MTSPVAGRKDLLRYLLAEVQAERLEAARAKAFIAGLDPVPEPIAIIGMACRFPDADGYGSFWENLKEGRQSIRAFPQHRADDYARMSGHGEDFQEGGYLDRIDLFDADYFGIPPKAAQVMDPYHRNLLEVLVEALEDAGYCRSQVQGSRTGIFVGNDHTHRQLTSYLPFVSSSDFSTILGSWTGMLASRLAYYFDLGGPAQVIDTGCSSALVALDAAISALRNGDCETAFVAGANLFLCPTSIGHETESHEARVRAFDAAANGTVWSEGVAALLVKPLSRALADGDPIHSVVLGVATNNDGRTNGITAPNAQAQKDVIVAAWNRARLSPASMGYLEAHGTGTRLGDPIEILGLTKAFAAFTDNKQFCAMGSVKSNIGHTVGVAGLASLIKTSLCLENAQIPPTVHFDTPNPLLDIASSPVFINDRLTAWEETGEPRRAGVSSFSLSGTNSHVVLQEAPRRDDRPPWPPATTCSRSPRMTRKISASLRSDSMTTSWHTLSSASTTCATRSRSPAIIATTGSSWWPAPSRNSSFPCVAWRDWQIRAPLRIRPRACSGPRTASRERSCAMICLPPRSRSCPGTPARSMMLRDGFRRAAASRCPARLCTASATGAMGKPNEYLEPR